MSISDYFDPEVVEKAQLFVSPVEEDELEVHLGMLMEQLNLDPKHAPQINQLGFLCFMAGRIYQDETGEYGEQIAKTPPGYVDLRVSSLAAGRLLEFLLGDGTE